jgi:hypothetical protein
MPDVRDWQKQQDGKSRQQQGGAGEKGKFQSQQLSQNPEHGTHQKGGSRHMSSDQISFYDESLKRDVQGSFKSDGRSIHVFSVYGTKRASYSDLGPCIDYNAQVLVAQKLLSELVGDSGGGHEQQAQSTEAAYAKVRPT